MKKEKKKKEKDDNLSVNEKEQLRKCEKKGKKVICDNLDDGKKKRHLKKENNKRKKEKFDNVDDNEKEQFKK